MSKPYDSFIAACEKAVTPEKAALSPEFLAAAKTVGSKVEAWGLEHGLMTPKSLPRGGKFFAALESFEADKIETAIGPQAVADLIADCGIPKCYEAQAARKVAAVLCQVLGKSGEIAFTDYISNDPELRGDVQSLESLYGSDLWNFVEPGTEAFGIQMDRVTPDLKTIVTVALLQFHVSLTPRIVPIQTVTQSNVQITREMMDVFDMSKPDEPPTRVIDLYRDPEMVDNRAVRIVPNAANDANNDFVVSFDGNGIYKFEEDLNLLKLSLDATRPGYDKINHTDIIEDGIAVDGVLIEITKAGTEGTPAQGTEGEEGYVPATEGTEAATEQFLVPLNPGKARLTQVPNDYRSTERRLTLDRTTLAFNAGTEQYGSGEQSQILADFPIAGGKYLAIALHLTAHVDRKTGNASASAWGKPTIRSVDPAYKFVAKDDNGDDTEDGALLKQYTVKFVGFQLDARFNEDNKRKTSIRAEINRRNMSYELPSGRNFVIDFAIGQEGAVNAAARLAQLEHIGRDGKNLRIVEDVLDRVHDMRMQLGNGAAANTEIAATYAAGDQVHQIAYRDTLDLGTGFLAFRSSDAEGDLKQFFKFRLNKIATGLLATSLLPQQLAEGTPVTFRVVTSPYILGALISCRQIHKHLDDMDQRGSGSVEYVMNLDCGAKLEFVTTTFSKMTNRLLMIPFFESAPTSVYNYGTDFDQGTLVGAITLGADNSSAHNRIFSTTRECLIPTNVVGAVITITGLGDYRIALDFPGIEEPVDVPAGEGDNG